MKLAISKGRRSPVVWLCFLSVSALLILPHQYSLLPWPSASETGPSFTTNITEWERLRDAATFVAPESHCGVRATGEVEVTARDSRAAAAAATTPYLFDTASMPDGSCAHCTKENMNTCCRGLCVFEGRRCDTLYPGEHKVEAVLSRYSEADGYRFREFGPCELFQRIRGRVLWFMGDSQTWHFYKATECFLREFALTKVRSNVSQEFAASEEQREAALGLNTLCMRLAASSRVCGIRVDSAPEMTKKVLPTLRRLRGDSLHGDIMAYNVGLHHSPFNSKYKAQLETLASFVPANKGWLPQMVWIDTAVQHFDTPDGAYPGAKKPFACKPLAAWYQGDPLVLAGGRYNKQAARYLDKLGDGHLRTWNASIPLWDVHKPGECTHWCYPTAYSLWIYLLNGELARAGLGGSVSLRAGRS